MPENLNHPIDVAARALGAEYGDAGLLHGYGPHKLGGFDGVLVTFGEGTDDDTATSTLFHYPLIQITLRDGTEFDALGSSATWDSTGACVVEYTPADDDGEPAGERTTVPFEDVVGVKVY